MPATLLTAQVISLTGITPSYSSPDAANGNEFLNDGKMFVQVKNTNAAAKNVTFASQSNCSFGFDHDVVVSVPATTGDKMVGPFPINRFNDGNAKVQITYESGITGSVGVFQLPV